MFLLCDEVIGSLDLFHNLGDEPKILYYNRRGQIMNFLWKKKEGVRLQSSSKNDKTVQVENWNGWTKAAVL